MTTFNENYSKMQILRNISKKFMALALIVVGLAASGCIFMRGGYSFSGASIPDAAKTFSVAYFPNNAPMVSPTLSTMLTEALRDKFLRQTKLQMVNEDGDFAFDEEEINDALKARQAYLAELKEKAKDKEPKKAAPAKKGFSDLGF